MKLLKETTTYHKKIKTFIIEWEGKELEVIKTWEYSEEPEGYETDYMVIEIDGEDIGDKLHDFIQELE